ncbi:MAG TPA: substrate-binding domain-containing protein [Bryobacteraceae bacterium]|nr:substrate-binding domain-containing protein [Bryobacteraceae bacterium]
MRERQNSDRYICQAVARACDIIDCFQTPEDRLRLSEIAAKTGLSTSTAFRILHTLEQRGLVLRVGERQYQLRIHPAKRRKYRIGFAGQTQEFSFSRSVAESVKAASAKADIDLLVLDNHYSSKAALRNADTFVRERVELAIEFQTDEHVAPVISSKLLEANIPMIAVEIPHPGATYYGADNYNAGVMGGRLLGRWAKQHWKEPVQEVVLLELSMAGSLPRARLTGILTGIRDIIPSIEDSAIFWLDGKGQFGTSLEMVRKHLRQNRARRVLIGAINDPSALGALRAMEEAGRADTCAAMGQNASLEARTELRKPSTRLIGSVAYFPELYGNALITLATDILQRKPVPPAVFVKHQMVTRENVDRLYPNDALLSPGELETLLLKSR